MKKKFAALLTAILCMTAAVSAVPASAVDAKTGTGESYTISTEAFTYTPQLTGFTFESEVCEPDFLVVGIEYCADDPNEIGTYIITTIDRPESNTFGQGVGWLWPSVIQDLGGIELHVGDLLKFDGGYDVAESSPPYYCPNSEDDPYSEPTTVIYLGNGVDLFGKEFERVIRMQSAIEQARWRRWMQYEDFNIDWGGVKLTRGDVNLDDELDILDCISVNKYLLGSSNFCFYTKNLADVNMDGKLDSTDSLAILKEVVGLTVNYEPIADEPAVD